MWPTLAADGTPRFARDARLVIGPGDTVRSSLRCTRNRRSSAFRTIQARGPGAYDQAVARSWLGRHIDALLAVGLTALGQAEVWSGLAQGGPRGPVAVAVAVGTAAVAVRRSHPIAAVIVSCGSLTAQAALGVDENTAFAPLLAAFLAIGTAGYLSTRPLVALCCAVVLIWSAVLISHGIPLDSHGSFPVAGDLLYAAILVALAWFVGRGFAVGRLQRQLSGERATAAAAQERLRIAREVHDIVAHSISVMALHAGGARRLLRADQTQAIEALEVVEATGRQALAEIKQVLTDVRAPGTPPTILTRETLDRTLEPLRAAGLQVGLVVGELPEPLPTAIGAAGLRVVQDAVTNVLRHANAAAVDIAVGVSDGRLTLEIVDDGTGSSDQTNHGGHGICGMQERLAEVGEPCGPVR